MEINAPKHTTAARLSIGAPLSVLFAIQLTVNCWENQHTHSLSHRRIVTFSETSLPLTTSEASVNVASMSRPIPSFSQYCSLEKLGGVWGRLVHMRDNFSTPA